MVIVHCGAPLTPSTVIEPPAQCHTSEHINMVRERQSEPNCSSTGRYSSEPRSCTLLQSTTPTTTTNNKSFQIWDCGSFECVFLLYLFRTTRQRSGWCSRTVNDNPSAAHGAADRSHPSEYWYWIGIVIYMANYIILFIILNCMFGYTKFYHSNINYSGTRQRWVKLSSCVKLPRFTTLSL